MNERILSDIVRELAETNQLLRDIEEQISDIRGALRLQRMLQLAGRIDAEPAPAPPRSFKPQA